MERKKRTITHRNNRNRFFSIVLVRFYKFWDEETEENKVKDEIEEEDEEFLDILDLEDTDDHLDEYREGDLSDLEDVTDLDDSSDFDTTFCDFDSDLELWDPQNILKSRLVFLILKLVFAYIGSAWWKLVIAVRFRSVRRRKSIEFVSARFLLYRSRRKSLKCRLLTRISSSYNNNSLEVPSITSIKLKIGIKFLSLENIRVF